MHACPSKRGRRDSGQALIEYALVLMFVAIGLLLALVLLGTEVRGSYGRVSNTLETAGAPEAGAGPDAGAGGRPAAPTPAGKTGSQAGGQGKARGH
jgi:Flp pilus assembly pilin Flp